MHGHEYSSDNDAGGVLPAGVLRSRGGWEDTNNIEMEHQRDQLLRAGADGAPGRVLTQNHAAVDLSQFRNEEVGKGYKAKHVVRQKDATASVASVVDMSGGKFSQADKKKNEEYVHHGSYMESKGIRDFLKEIDKILKPSTKEQNDSIRMGVN